MPLENVIGEYSNQGSNQVTGLMSIDKLMLMRSGSINNSC